MAASSSMLIKGPVGCIDWRNAPKICWFDLDGGCTPKCLSNGNLVMCNQVPGQFTQLLYSLITASKTASALFGRSLDM